MYVVHIDFLDEETESFEIDKVRVGKGSYAHCLRDEKVSIYIDGESRREVTLL